MINKLRTDKKLTINLKCLIIISPIKNQYTDRQARYQQQITQCTVRLAGYYH